MHSVSLRRRSDRSECRKSVAPPAGAVNAPLPVLPGGLDGTLEGESTRPVDSVR